MEFRLFWSFYLFHLFWHLRSLFLSIKVFRFLSSILGILFDLFFEEISSSDHNVIRFPITSVLFITILFWWRFFIWKSIFTWFTWWILILIFCEFFQFCLKLGQNFAFKFLLHDIQWLCCIFIGFLLFFGACSI